MKDGDRFCRNDDTMGATPLNGMICKWDKNIIKWTIVKYLKAISPADMKLAFTEAWAQVKAACNIEPIWVDSPTQADIVVTSNEIDGVSNILAESEMPCGTNGAQLNQTFDDAEHWVLAVNPVGNVIDLKRVCLHEILHCIGVPHLPNGNLMSPYYSISINSLQEADISELTDRYGPPLVQVSPTTPVAPPTPANPVTPPFDLAGLLSKLLIALLGKLFPATPAPAPVPQPKPIIPPLFPGLNLHPLITIFTNALQSWLKGLLTPKA